LIYWLQNYLIIGFVPPMLAIITKLADFEQMWKIQYMVFWKFLVYGSICKYIIFNDNFGYGRLEELTSCLGVYALWHYYKMEITYQKYVQQIPNTPNSCPNFVITQPKVIFYTMENKRKCEEWCWGQIT
jgi:hypothetical protein